LRRIFGTKHDEVLVGGSLCVPFKKKFSDDINQDVMGGACSTEVEVGKCAQGFGGGI